MSEKIAKAIYESGDTPLKIGDFELECYVLDNGQRVLSRTGMLKALGLSHGSAGGKGGDRLASFAKGKRVSAFVDEGLTALIEKPIKFNSSRGTVAFGYEAEVLQKIVRAVTKAYLSGNLQAQQARIGQRAEMLDDAFSATGLIALVDEATGYLYAKERAKDSFQKFFEKFLRDKAAKWVKTFPDQFFEMLFRLHNLEWVDLKKRPSFFGHNINDFVYSRIAPGVLDELRTRNPKKSDGNRKHRHHQYLSKDWGHPAIKEHIEGVMALARATRYNMPAFKKLLDNAYPKYGHTLKIEFPEEELIDTKTVKKTNFDQKLNKALNYNPREEG